MILCTRAIIASSRTYEIKVDAVINRQAALRKVSQAASRLRSSLLGVRLAPTNKWPQVQRPLAAVVRNLSALSTAASTVNEVPNPDAIIPHTAGLAVFPRQLPPTPAELLALPNFLASKLLLDMEDELTTRSKALGPSPPDHDALLPAIRTYNSSLAAVIAAVSSHTAATSFRLRVPSRVRAVYDESAALFNMTVDMRGRPVTSNSSSSQQPPSRKRARPTDSEHAADDDDEDIMSSSLLPNPKRHKPLSASTTPAPLRP
ncbi:uncharacterized protein AMSG_05957 [Thecamonas trahens ATCC 50062]|uniref:Uncharacterized protein n=1 Tax=Thecamonas trahens ATCC 50062 TaxID=461836 RepID=A0A0L0DBG8_THETB|nr:hypothetical protein AMSG_05957 [Thecamonas trahens ATCC 50062]KNC49694.1 hypothetical protein AMSG_05957 [Thecamonas trahens ATCC 50062]|eukprot:XP_013757489.1 hypothetical protein AMSG_05957 [Thecamonas trahens ATCC 50062]